MATTTTGPGPIKGSSPAAPAQLAPPPSVAGPNRLADRLGSWYIKQVAHTIERVRCDKKGRWLGLAVVILTTIVGTTAFSTLGKGPSTAAKAAAAVFSISAAIAAAVKEYAQYEKRGADHLSAAAAYGDLRNGAERLLDQLTSGTTTPAAAEQELERLEESAETQDMKSPAIPNAIYARAKTWVQDRNRERRES